MTAWYNEDLAYIHDVGFREYVLKSTPGILEMLSDRQIQTGLVVELGCGSGLSAEVGETDRQCAVLWLSTCRRHIRCDRIAAYP
jgi:hypothetical protein